MAKHGENHYDLDLSQFGRPARIRVTEGYSCTLPADMPLASVVRLQRAFGPLGKAMTETEGDFDAEALRSYEDEMWEVAEDVLARATPPPTAPIRSLLSTAAMVRLMVFLTRGFTAALTETTEAMS